MTLTKKKLVALVKTGATNREIIAALGKPMTKAQRSAVDKARLSERLRIIAKRKETPAASTDRHSDIRSEHSRVTWAEPKDPARRKRLEADPKKWLKYYLPQAYTRKFEKPHEEIIDAALNAHETNSRFAVSALRGIGKSTILWGLILFLKLSGKQPYPICVPWAVKALKRAFRFWKMALCFNDRLAADYPEYCAPFRHARGIPQRVSTTTWRDGPNAGKLTGAQLTVGEGMIVLPDQIGCIGGSTINGNVRGLNHAHEDGRVIRPSLVLLDDVQDRTTAKSAIQVQDVIDTIDSDIAGCGEAGKDLPMLMSGNCIVPDDVMAHYLEDPGWQSLKVPCVLRWPTGWEDDTSKCKILWAEWHDRFLRHAAAPTFYKKNKAAMTKGMKLSAPATYRKGGKTKDALYAVMQSYYKMGHEAFMAEAQQSPERRSFSLYILTPKLIQSRTDTERTAAMVPDWSHLTIASTDVNPSYALSSVVVAFGKDQLAGVLWYGLYRQDPLPVTRDMTVAEQRKRIYNALMAHGTQLAGLSCRPNLWVVDGRGSPEATVIDMAYNAPAHCGLETICAFGAGARQYRPTAAKHKVTRVGEQVHQVVQSRAKQWMIWNADYWREIAQKGWTGAPGAPGSCSLPKGNHSDFARQICGEQLERKGEGLSGRTEWIWRVAPGPHDYGDSMAMAYACAAFAGIGTGGIVETRGTRKSYSQADLRRK